MTSIPPKTRKQIADEYGWSISTFRRRLIEYCISLPKGKLVAAYQKLIYEKLSYPAPVERGNYFGITTPRT